VNRCEQSQIISSDWIVGKAGSNLLLGLLPGGTVFWELSLEVLLLGAFSLPARFVQFPCGEFPNGGCRCAEQRSHLEGEEKEAAF